MHIATTRRMSNAKCADARERSQIQGRIGVYSPRLRSDARAMLSLIISSSHMPAYGSLSQQTKIEECLLFGRTASRLHFAYPGRAVLLKWETAHRCFIRS